MDTFFSTYGGGGGGEWDLSKPDQNMAQVDVESALRIKYKINQRIRPLS